MPVIGTAAGDVVCSDLALVESGAVSHEGCPLLTRQRAILVDKGVKATVRWEMRDRAGAVVDLTTCLDCTVAEASESLSLSESASLSASVSEPVSASISEGCGKILVRIGACDEQGTIYEVTGTVDTPSLGLIRFQLPNQVYNAAGIWRMQIAITDADGVPVFLNTGLISVERGMFGDFTKTTGPPSLNEIRMHIRDTAVENDLLMAVEFDDDEIVHAIIRPVAYWNETPPQLRRYVYSCATFPFRYYWLNGVVAQLLRTASHAYMRNKLQTSHGGVKLNDRDKNQEYMQMSTLYWGEYEQFVYRKKVELNAAQMFGSVGSAYGAGG